VARVVVAGGGLGGCAVAARLAKLGHQVRLLERRDRVGGAIGYVEQDGYRWDAGPASTALPAVLRDLFRKSGRPLERELELVPVEPMREHRFEDGTVLPLPAGSRAAQRAAIEQALGPAAAIAWLDYTHAFADVWDRVRRGYLERVWSPDHVDPETAALLASRRSLRREVHRRLKDPRLRAVAWQPLMLDGHDPRNVPAWMGMLAYVEQNFGTWTVPGGLGALSDLLTKRLRERRVDVSLDTHVEDLLVQDGRAMGVRTSTGVVEADVVVCAVDPRVLPATASLVRRTMPALPPLVCHLGLDGDVPDLPPEVVLHGDPLLVVRTGGHAPPGGTAWTVLGRGRLAEDLLTALARRGLDVRAAVRTRVDRTPRDLVEAWGGSPYGVLWQGRATLQRRAGTTTPWPNVFCAGAHAGPGAGIPFVGLGAALVAQAVGKA
jgi:UDP-galactopyranose mutase